MHEVHFPAQKKDLANLRAGDSVLVNGLICTARDAAHRRLCEMLCAGEQLPLELAGQAIYYCGPCPAPPGRVIGSCGPTSAVRMDAYAPILYAQGVRAVIAKGPVSNEVHQAIRENGACYLCAAGGAGALLSQCVRSVREVAFADLGTESIKCLEVTDMPVLVGIDSLGGSLFSAL